MPGLNNHVRCAAAFFLCSSQAALAAAPTPGGSFDGWVLTPVTPELVDPACVMTADSTSIDGFIPAPDNNHYGTIITEGGFFQRQTDDDITPPTITPQHDFKFNIPSLHRHAVLIELAPTNGNRAPTVSDDQTDSFDFSALTDAVIGPFPPGRHTLTWLARDEAGNLAAADQGIRVWPMAEFAPDQVVGEDGNAWVSVYLNGEAPDYPVTIPFSISGTATNPDDHNAVDGNIVIEEGTYGFTIVRVYGDNEPENDETITLTMGNPTNAINGNTWQHTITITEHNQAPRLSFSINQDGKNTPLVVSSSGQVTVNVNAKDANPNDRLNYDWSQSNAGLVSSDCSQSKFIFDPSNLSAGLYRIFATVTDDGSPVLSSSAELFIRIVYDEPAMSVDVDSDSDGSNDESEGFHDNDQDGIPNHLDVVDQDHLIPGHWTTSYKTPAKGKALNNHYSPEPGEVGWDTSKTVQHINYPMLIATRPGLKLSTSSVQLRDYAQTNGVALRPTEFDPVDPALDTEDEVQTGDDQFMVSLKIGGLREVDASVKLVIPQASIYDHSHYRARVRSYTPALGWQDFFEDERNLVSSASRQANQCLDPDSINYKPGLVTPFDFECLRLTMEDGGPNDADGLQNGQITFHGRIALEKFENSFSVWFDIVTAEEPQPFVATEISSPTAPPRDSGPANGSGAIWLIPMFCLLGFLLRAGEKRAIN